jgi:cell wall-associated NlpC family hydrolase
VLDPRVNAFRPDLADADLKGRVEAARFVRGEPGRIAVAHAALRRGPFLDATMLTEALFGEPVSIFETTPEGWAWVQLGTDGYVGWMQADEVAGAAPEPTHKVSTLATFAFAAPDIKTRPLLTLPLGARVSSAGEAEDRNARYALIAPKGAVVVQHLTPLDAVEADWVAVAERFLGVPYLWGGRTAAGIDCSGLVQLALQSVGVAAPRDSDMQEASVGEALTRGTEELRRGDLVFWKGHVGIMCDAERLLHANAHAMAVSIEPLAEAEERSRREGSGMTSIRRLMAD